MSLCESYFNCAGVMPPSKFWVELMKFVKAYFGKLNLKLNCFQLVNVEHCTCKFGIFLVLGEAYDQKCFILCNSHFWAVFE